MFDQIAHMGGNAVCSVLRALGIDSLAGNLCSNLIAEYMLGFIFWSLVAVVVADMIRGIRIV